jgi:hypothetical protein
MGSSEVQVFDGDGTVPPEITKLIRENELLREQNRYLSQTNKQKDEDIQDLLRENRFLAKKLNSISFIISQPEEKDRDDYPCDKDDPRDYLTMQPEYEPNS